MSGIRARVGTVLGYSPGDERRAPVRVCLGLRGSRIGAGLTGFVDADEFPPSMDMAGVSAIVVTVAEDPGSRRGDNALVPVQFLVPLYDEWLALSRGHGAGARLEFSDVAYARALLGKCLQGPRPSRPLSAGSRSRGT